MKEAKLTLTEFLDRQSPVSSEGDRVLRGLLQNISTAAKLIHANIGRAGITNLLGDSGTVNIQGEKVQRLDAFADDQLTRTLQEGMNCAGVVSEEKEDILVFDGEVSNRSRYVVMFDPLDGSSNINANISVGTIFGIYFRKSQPGKPCDFSDFLQPGNRQVAAGYILYGCSAVLVYANNREVNGFTLDPDTGEFYLSHPLLRCPERGGILSVNQGYFYRYSREVQQYILSCQQPCDGQKIITHRYVGSMVADVHRTLLTGGIFMYPGTHEKPNGKLRLLYECNPLSFVIEASGGQATNGRQRVSDIIPVSLHQVTPVYMGSVCMVKQLAGVLGSSCIATDRCN